MPTSGAAQISIFKPLIPIKKLMKETIMRLPAIAAEILNVTVFLKINQRISMYPAERARRNDANKIVTDMMNQLEPNAPLLNMFPGREKASYNAGIVTNAFYGAVLGFIVSFLLLVLLKIGGI